jgi:hypothetical protein
MKVYYQALAYRPGSEPYDNFKLENENALL